MRLTGLSVRGNPVSGSVASGVRGIAEASARRRPLTRRDSEGRGILGGRSGSCLGRDREGGREGPGGVAGWCGPGPASGCSAPEQVGCSPHCKDDRMRLDQRTWPGPHHVTAGSSPGGLSGLRRPLRVLPPAAGTVPLGDRQPGSLGALGAPVGRRPRRRLEAVALEGPLRGVTAVPDGRRRAGSRARSPCPSRWKRR